MVEIPRGAALTPNSQNYTHRDLHPTNKYPSQSTFPPTRHCTTGSDFEQASHRVCPFPATVKRTDSTISHITQNNISVATLCTLAKALEMSGRGNTLLFTNVKDGSRLCQTV